MSIRSNVAIACVFVLVCVSFNMCLRVPSRLHKLVNKSYRTQQNRSLSRVYNDPPSWNAKCVLEYSHKLSVHMCISACACITKMHFGRKRQLCLPSCICVHESLKRTRLRVHACVWKCVLRHWYSIALSNLWLNRSHHVCIRRPDRLCSFQPCCMLMPLSASLVGLRPPLHALDLHSWLMAHVFFLLSLFLIWRFIWMYSPSELLSCRLCTLASFAREQDVVHQVGQDWNSLIIPERYSYSYILVPRSLTTTQKKKKTSSFKGSVSANRQHVHT